MASRTFDLCNAVHKGYIDGINDDLNKSFGEDTYYQHLYDKGYLAGMEDREKALVENPEWKAPKFLGPVGIRESGISRRNTYTVPKGTTVSTISHGVRKAGRTYKIKAHDIYEGSPAYERHGEIVRPEPPKLLWAGTSGYWSTASVNEIPEIFTLLSKLLNKEDINVA